MTTKLSIITLALALAIGHIMSPPALALGCSSPLVGAWRMTTLEVGTAVNLQAVPYSGQIIFTASCNVSVQAMNPDANAPATPYTMSGYESYYGTYSIDDAAKTFAMTPESSLVRDLIGQTMTRGFEVSGDTLVLTPTDPAEGWRVTYERI
jgi:hypothetical protein